MEKCQAKAAENKARRKEHRVRVKEQTEQCQQLHLRLQVQCTLESLLMLGLMKVIHTFLQTQDLKPHFS